MASNTWDFMLRRPWTTAVIAVVALLLMGWGFFHPELRPDVNTITPSVREGLAKTGFRQTEGVSSARFEIVESGGGFSENSTSEQKIIPIDGVITEKRTRQRAKGLSEEFSGLYVGPFVVIRFYRSRPPLIGDLLPYQFWSSLRMSEFIVEETDGFPDTKGGKMRARVTYEDHYAGGELAQIESRWLQCDVTNIVDAASINARLSGTAARIECREELETNGRRLGVNNPQTYSVGNLSYSHWYIANRGWSIPIEGQRAVRLRDADEIFTWSSKLVSFESSSQ
jgi:hypothetical protein